MGTNFSGWKNYIIFNKQKLQFVIFKTNATNTRNVRGSMSPNKWFYQFSVYVIHAQIKSCAIAKHLIDFAFVTLFNKILDTYKNKKVCWFRELNSVVWIFAISWNWRRNSNIDSSQMLSWFGFQIQFFDIDTLPSRIKIVTIREFCIFTLNDQVQFSLQWAVIHLLCTFLSMFKKNSLRMTCVRDH